MKHDNRKLKIKNLKYVLIYGHIIYKMLKNFNQRLKLFN